MKDLTKEIIKVSTIGTAIMFLAIGVCLAPVFGGFFWQENRIASYHDMSVKSYLFGEYIDKDGNIYRYDDTHKVMVKQGE